MIGSRMLAASVLLEVVLIAAANGPPLVSHQEIQATQNINQESPIRSKSRQPEMAERSVDRPDQHTTGNQVERPVSVDGSLKSTSEGNEVDVERPRCAATRRGSDISCGEINPDGQSAFQANTSNRIFWGNETRPGAVPYQVRLNLTENHGDRRKHYICGGVIIDEWHILTAAHCVKSCEYGFREVEVTIGDYSRSSSADCETKIEIRKTVVHEHYKECEIYEAGYDIAMLQTKSKMDFKFTSSGYGSVNQVCMPTHEAEEYEGIALASGWGRTELKKLSDTLRQVEIPIIKSSDCNENFELGLTDKHICAGQAHVGGFKGVHKGDSGGPLIKVINGRHQLIGLASYIRGRLEPKSPAVFVKVSAHLNWIRETKCKMVANSGSE